MIVTIYDVFLKYIIQFNFPPSSAACSYLILFYSLRHLLNEFPEVSHPPRAFDFCGRDVEKRTSVEKGEKIVQE